ncbi:MAG: phosphodiester glycosidase family protein [Clostridiales bacterium]|nr:phosphodiester glycosidase family protein [Clostridiales bacterium]
MKNNAGDKISAKKKKAVSAAAALLGCAALLLLFSSCKDADALPAMARPSVPAETPIGFATPTSPEKTPLPTPAPTPEPTPSGLCGGRFDVFTDGEVIQTENEYRTREVAVFLSEVHRQPGEISDYQVSYLLADIYVQNIADLRCATAKGSLDSRMRVRDLAETSRAAIAITGDYTAWRDKGFSVRNGEIFRTKEHKTRDIGVMFSDGVLRTFEAGTFDVQEILALNPLHVWSFGPELLSENGASKTEFCSTIAGKRSSRAVIGYYEPGHYCFVLVFYSTRQSSGILMADLSRLMQELGCVSAYNLDGGATAHMYFNGKVHRAHNGTRPVNDIIYVPLAD